MDQQIISTAVFSFVLFLLLIALLFRITKKEAAILWMVRAFVCVSIVVVCIRFGTWRFVDYAWWAVLYSELTALFIFGVFSIMEASITLAIFSRVAMHQHIPTKEQIVQKRIDRLLYSGEIQRVHGEYCLGNMSYFRLRELIFIFFRSCFQ